MKAQDFLQLVKKTLVAQQDYYTARRKGSGVITERDLLIKSKDLEKKCWTVINVGTLEPDEPTATVIVHTTEEYQRLWRLDKPAKYTYLDLPGIERPDGQGEQPT